MKFLAFLSTVRDSTSIRPTRLSLRVARACLNCFEERYTEHQVELIDPLYYPLDTIFSPHFNGAKCLFI